ncbi:hypothetical protein QBC37DRAFT_404349 [Rhypophila decipiens]|uniref:Antifreeze protein n=1 Tax=Rhypophila decipiens TaxID=261697 RepID=A0AAN6XYU9_9PEZI|nr:hypothetical protein QBC37DRAFT_404349 [Rhypophila decipiens]
MLSTITIILAALGNQLVTGAPADTIESHQLVKIITGCSGTNCGGTPVLTSTGILSPGLCYTTTAGDINSYRPIASALLTTCTATSYNSTDSSGTALSSGLANGHCINNPTPGHSIRITC